MTDGKKRNSKEDRAKECPALKNNLKCNKCGKPNHMEKVCQSTESKSGGGEANPPSTTHATTLKTPSMKERPHST